MPFRFPLRLAGVLCFFCTDFSLHAFAALKHRTWSVDGITHEALVVIPARTRTKPTPVIFVFHVAFLKTRALSPPSPPAP